MKFNSAGVMHFEFLFLAVFWSASVGIFLVYAGYPVFVYIASVFLRRSVLKRQIYPRLTFIIAARNEAMSIRQKLDNTLSLSYPADKMEIIVVSDSSSDETDQIVLDFQKKVGADLRLLRQEERLGKTAAQNLAAAHASGDVLVFSDATTVYSPDSLRALVRNFSDKTVGCVAGTLRYINQDDAGIGSGTIHYWNYESFIKSRESMLGSLIGVSGCIYAVRASAYEDMYPQACSDFVIALQMRRKGLRTVYEPDALAYESTNKSPLHEFRARIRITSQTLFDLWTNSDLFNPINYGLFSVQLIMHKLLRYFVPFFLLLTLLSSGLLALDSLLFAGIFLAQVLFYLLGIIGWGLASRSVNVSLFSLPLYFVLVNLAFAAGFFNFFRGNSYSIWEPVRENS
ncbi:MAG: glycosyltransferase family 2 protein [Pyrinomonadaceae bacterium]|jgi:cellulose synthase/poly-beta-1,6-N-acetylglucosamine synthase-like glycosyltransferase